jgi:hypothetical protein
LLDTEADSSLRSEFFGQALLRENAQTKTPPGNTGGVFFKGE